MSEEIQKKIVEEGDADGLDPCEAFLKQHRLEVIVIDNRNAYRHNQSKLIRAAHFTATVSGIFFNGYGDTREEAIQDFREQFNKNSHTFLRSPQ